MSALRRAQPRGPYRIGGFSFGGMVAWEMACQLCALGEAVALLALFDAYGPRLNKGLRLQHGPLWRSFGTRSFELAQKFRLHCSMLAHLPPGQRWPYLRDKFRGRLAWLQPGPNAQADNPPANPALRVHQAQIRALRDYQPPVYPGRVTLFRGHLHLTRIASRDRELGWTGLAGQGVDVREMPGFHQLMIVEPFVKYTAGELKACLAAIPSEVPEWRGSAGNPMVCSER